MNRSLGIVVHGYSGVGKSWFGSTTPPIRLILDAEGGSRFTPGTKIEWDGQNAPPPPPGTPLPNGLPPGVDLHGIPLWDGPEGPSMPYYDTVTCTIRSFRVMTSVYQWLNSGQHPFESVVVDSLTEVQKRLQDQIAGTDQMRTQDWGQLLREMEDLVRKMRDLTFHATKPLSAVVLLAITSDKYGKNKPHVQGQLAISLPYFMDIVGYLYTETNPAGQGRHHRLLLQPTDDYEAKDRTNRLPAVMDIGDLNGYDGTSTHRMGVTRMIDTVFGPPPQEQPAA